jgi:phosphatidylserine/phosphatidylglycerophosphate/cardiolipin synthase-like enzyme
MVPELQVIVVLPVAPEEVNEKGGADRITQHGLFLQHGVLTRLADALGVNFGMFSLIAQRKPEKASSTNVAGSHQIYVHNKCLVVDDVYAHVSSANTNPRSFEVDTEVGLGWYEPESVRPLRESLWRELLGNPDMSNWQTADYVKEWSRIALGNLRETKNFARRRGFVVPHDPDRFPGSDQSSLFNFAGFPRADRLTQIVDPPSGEVVIA